jgi:hypothetical protein
MKPIKKLQTAGLGGALGVIVLYLVGQAGVELPAEVAAAVAAIVTWGAGYFQRDPLVDAGRKEQGDPETE